MLKYVGEPALRFKRVVAGLFFVAFAAAQAPPGAPPVGVQSAAAWNRSLQVRVASAQKTYAGLLSGQVTPDASASEYLRLLRQDLGELTKGLVAESGSSEVRLALNRASVNSLLDAIRSYEKALGGDGVFTSPWNVLTDGELVGLRQTAEQTLAALTKSAANYPEAETPLPLVARIDETRSWLNALKQETVSRNAHPQTRIKAIGERISVAAARSRFQEIDAFDGRGAPRNFQRNLAVQVAARLQWSPNDSSLLLLKEKVPAITLSSFRPDRPRPPPDAPPGRGLDGFKQAAREMRTAASEELNAVVQRNPTARAMARARMRIYGGWLRLASGGKAEDPNSNLVLFGTEDLLPLREGYRGWYSRLVRESQIKPFDDELGLDIKDAAVQLGRLDVELRRRLIVASEPSLPSLPELSGPFARGPPEPALAVGGRFWLPPGTVHVPRCCHPVGNTPLSTACM
jgi:hypothetical protein